MSLASPDKLIWLLVALPIIGFYILKTRLRRRQVATLLFWDQIFEEKRQRSLWQNLRHWLSLLLQLLFVGLLVFALADPLWRSQSSASQELILVVDNSASMRAVDPDTGRSRLDEAIEQAADVAKGLRQGDSISLITAGNSVRVVVGMTDFGPSITEALQTIEPTDGPTRVEEAIEVGRRLSSDPDRRRIIVFSDGCLPHDTTSDDERNVNAPVESQTSRPGDAMKDFQIPSADDLRWVQVGSSVHNLAITTFQVRRSTVDPIGYALLVEITNFSENAAKTRLKLELDDALIDVIPLELEAGEVWRTTIDGTSRQGGVLTGSIDVTDGLLVDNLARAIVPARPMIPVTLYFKADSESFYLRTVLDSIALIELTEQDIDAVENATDSPTVNPTASNRLSVFSGISPTQLPDGPTLVIAATQNGPTISVDGSQRPAWVIGEAIESPIIATQNKESPLLRHVQLQNVILDGGRDIAVDESLGEVTTLLETAGGAKVMVSIERLSGRILLLSADLDSSDLPLRIAFPVMMSNAMNWFFRETGEMNPALNTGEVTSVDWDVAGKTSVEAMLVDEQGKRRGITVDRDRAAIGPISGAGVYGLFDATTLPKSEEAPEGADDDKATGPRELLARDDVQGRLIAVNLCDPSESDLRLPELSQQAAGDPSASGAPAWFYLVVLAIGLVIAEWGLFNRRVVA